MPASGILGRLRDSNTLQGRAACNSSARTITGWLGLFLQKSLQDRETLQAVGLPQALSSKKSASQKW